MAYHRHSVGTVLHGEFVEQSYLHYMDSDATSRLTNFLNSVSRGDPTDLRTPFFDKDLPREWFLREVNKFAYAGIEALDDYEHDEEGKVGPYSIRLPWDKRAESIEEYFNTSDVTPDLSATEYADDLLLNLIPRALVPLGLESAYGLMPRGTNLGLPKFTRKKGEERWYLDEARKLDALEYPLDTWFPSVVGWRGQPQGLNEIPKQRNVWMCSHVETIIGKTLVQPLVDGLRRREEFAAWNPLHRVDEIVTLMFDHAPQPILSIDFKSYDQRMRRFVIEHVFDAINMWFPGYERRVLWLREFFLTSGIVTPYGLRVGRSGSVPSGSSFTNMVDSLAHIWMAHYIAFRLRNELIHLTVLGDDGLWSYKGPFGMDDVSEAAAELGMEVSTSKSLLSFSEVHYLQRLHLKEYRADGICHGIRSLFRTVGSMISQERRPRVKFTPEMHSIRWISQCENCKHHPEFAKLVKFLYDGDKLLQQLDPGRLLAEVGGVGKAESFLGIRSFPYKNELTMDRFDEFRTVQLLRQYKREAGSRALVYS